MTVTNTFHWLDYLIFILMLVISAAIGIFYAVRDKRNQSTTNFLLGGRRMSVFPVTLSLMASFLSAILVLGVPTEIFYNGTMYWLISFSNLITFPVAAHAFLPVFHDLELTSAYEYLEKRFSRPVRIMGSVVFQLQMTLYMGVVLYAPAIALNQVMGIDILISILLIGAICTFYTAIGGLKAVMWTDAFQMVIVFAGVVAVVWKGTTAMGGFDVVWELAKNGSKLQADNFDPSPLERHTFWTLVIGGFVTSMTIYGSNQAMIQRYLSMETSKKAQTALYFQLPASIIFTSLLVYAGLVLFARYHDNDPVQSCLISKRDQLIPWLVMDILGQFHGFPGLMVACIFSASLSTVSSGVNALSLTFLTDIVKPAYRQSKGERMPERLSTILSKIFALGFGIVTIVLAFLAQYFGSLILQVALSIFGMVGGPLLGLFVCALFFPVINSWGAFIGVLASLGVTCWVAISSIIYRSNHMPPTHCTETSAGYNSTYNTTGATTTSLFTTTNPILNNSTQTADFTEQTVSGLEQLYHLSYLWYSTLAVSTTVLVALVISCATGGNKRKPIDRRLLSPWYLAIHDLATVIVAPSTRSRGSSSTSSITEVPGAFIGVLASLGVTCWVAISSIIYRSNHMPPTHCTETSAGYNSTYNTTGATATSLFTTANPILNNSTQTADFTEQTVSGLEQLYHLSYLWYSTLAVSTTVLVALVISCATGGNKRKPIDRRLLSPWYLAIHDLATVIVAPSTRSRGSSSTSSITDVPMKDREKNGVHILPRQTLVEEVFRKEHTF